MSKDKNGVAIGDRLLVAHQMNQEYYMTLGTVLSIDLQKDEETSVDFVIYEIQLARGEVMQIDEVNAIGLVVSNVPYFLVRYLALDFIDYNDDDEKGGTAVEVKPTEHKIVNKNLPSVPPRGPLDFHRYTIDELLDAYNLFSILKINDEYANYLENVINELKKRGGVR